MLTAQSDEASLLTTLFLLKTDGFHKEVGEVAMNPEFLLFPWGIEKICAVGLHVTNGA